MIIIGISLIFTVVLLVISIREIRYINGVIKELETTTEKLREERMRNETR